MQVKLDVNGEETGTTTLKLWWYGITCLRLGNPEIKSCTALLCRNATTLPKLDTLPNLT